MSGATARSWAARLLFGVGPLAYYVELGCHSTWNFKSTWWDVTINHLHSLFLMSVGNHLQVVQVVVSDYVEYDKMMGNCE